MEHISNDCFKDFVGIISQSSRTKLAPPYACLVIAYLEECKLFLSVLPNNFNKQQRQWIEKHYKRYMDNGFAALLKSIDITVFLKCLNLLYPIIHVTEEKATTTNIDGQETQMLDFLDVNVILNEIDQLETDIFYKTTNNEMKYESSHPTDTKQNALYNLAKRIICFSSDTVKVESRLMELNGFLLKCSYPIYVIEKGIFNTRLQGPAPKPKDKQNVYSTSNNKFCKY